MRLAAGLVLAFLVGTCCAAPPAQGQDNTSSVVALLGRIAAALEQRGRQPPKLECVCRCER